MIRKRDWSALILVKTFPINQIRGNVYLYRFPWLLKIIYYSTACVWMLDRVLLKLEFKHEANRCTCCIFWFSQSKRIFLDQIFSCLSYCDSCIPNLAGHSECLTNTKLLHVYQTDGSIFLSLQFRIASFPHFYQLRIPYYLFGSGLFWLILLW